jgi:hypothetical protein
MPTLQPKENVHAIFTFALGATFYVLTDCNQVIQSLIISGSEDVRKKDA